MQSVICQKNNVLKVSEILLKILLIFSFIATLITSSYADEQKSSSKTNEVELFVQKTADDILEIIKSNETQKIKSKKLQKVFLDTVDVEWMAKFALGKNLRRISKQEFKNYMEAYHEYLLQSYVPKFRNYHGQHFQIISSKTLGRGRYTVVTEIIDHNTGNKINVAYRCKIQKDQNLKVVDIVAENVSLLTSQRSEFNSIIANEGIEQLIQKLKSKTTASASHETQNTK